MQKQIQSAGKRGFFSKRSVGPQVREKVTFEDMLSFQKVIEIKSNSSFSKYVLYEEQKLKLFAGSNSNITAQVKC